MDQSQLKLPIRATICLDTALPIKNINLFLNKISESGLFSKLNIILLESRAQSQNKINISDQLSLSTSYQLSVVSSIQSCLQNVSNTDAHLVINGTGIRLTTMNVATDGLVLEIPLLRGKTFDFFHWLINGCQVIVQVKGTGKISLTYQIAAILKPEFHKGRALSQIALNAAYLITVTLKSILGRGQDDLGDIPLANRDIKSVSHFDSFLALKAVLTELKLRLIKYRFLKHFSIAYKECSIDSILNKSVLDFQSLKNPNCEFLADPFIFKNSEKPIIFAEYIPKKSSYGQIVKLTFDKISSEYTLTTLIQSNSHFSYPFILQMNSTAYLMPENSQSKTTRLYKLRASQSTGLEVSEITELFKADPLVDPTIAKIGDFYWLFCAKVDDLGETNDKLYIYYSTDGYTNWQPHYLNPVVINVTKARPAGPILRINSKLFRPSQNCSTQYGKEIILNEIIKLTPTEFEEVPRLRLKPASRSGIQRIHHISYSDSLIVIDYEVFHSRNMNCGENKKVMVIVEHLTR